MIDDNLLVVSTGNGQSNRTSAFHSPPPMSSASVSPGSSATLAGSASGANTEYAKQFAWHSTTSNSLSPISSSLSAAAPIGSLGVSSSGFHHGAYGAHSMHEQPAAGLTSLEYAASEYAPTARSQTNRSPASELGGTRNSNDHEPAATAQRHSSEYKEKFRPFDRYVYSEALDGFTATSNASELGNNYDNRSIAGASSGSVVGDNNDTPWYMEVVRRQQRANEYRYKSEMGHQSPLLPSADQSQAANDNESIVSAFSMSTTKFSPHDYRHDHLIAEIATHKSQAAAEDANRRAFSRPSNGATSGNSARTGASTARAPLRQTGVGQARARSQSSRRIGSSSKATASGQTVSGSQGTADKLPTTLPATPKRTAPRMTAAALASQRSAKQQQPKQQESRPSRPPVKTQTPKLDSSTNGTQKAPASRLTAKTTPPVTSTKPATITTKSAPTKSAIADRMANKPTKVTTNSQVQKTAASTTTATRPNAINGTAGARTTARPTPARPTTGATAQSTSAAKQKEPLATKTQSSAKPIRASAGKQNGTASKAPSAQQANDISSTTKKSSSTSDSIVPGVVAASAIGAAAAAGLGGVVVASQETSHDPVPDRPNGEDKTDFTETDIDKIDSTTAETPNDPVTPGNDDTDDEQNQPSKSDDGNEVNDDEIVNLDTDQTCNIETIDGRRTSEIERHDNDYNSGEHEIITNALINDHVIEQEPVVNELSQEALILTQLTPQVDNHSDILDDREGENDIPIVNDQQTEHKEYSDDEREASEVENEVCLDRFRRSYDLHNEIESQPINLIENEGNNFNNDFRASHDSIDALQDQDHVGSEQDINQSYPESNVNQHGVNADFEPSDEEPPIFSNRVDHQVESHRDVAKEDESKTSTIFTDGFVETNDTIEDETMGVADIDSNFDVKPTAPTSDFANDEAKETDKESADVAESKTDDEANNKENAEQDDSTKSQHQDDLDDQDQNDHQNEDKNGESDENLSIQGGKSEDKPEENESKEYQAKLHSDDIPMNSPEQEHTSEHENGNPTLSSSLQDEKHQFDKESNSISPNDGNAYELVESDGYADNEIVDLEPELEENRHSPSNLVDTSTEKDPIVDTDWQTLDNETEARSDYEQNENDLQVDENSKSDSHFRNEELPRADEINTIPDDGLELAKDDTTIPQSPNEEGSEDFEIIEPEVEVSRIEPTQSERPSQESNEFVDFKGSQFADQFNAQIDNENELDVTAKLESGAQGSSESFEQLQADNAKIDDAIKTLDHQDDGRNSFIEGHQGNFGSGEHYENDSFNHEQYPEQQIETNNQIEWSISPASPKRISVELDQHQIGINEPMINVNANEADNVEENLNDSINAAESKVSDVSERIDHDSDAIFNLDNFRAEKDDINERNDVDYSQGLNNSREQSCSLDTDCDNNDRIPAIEPSPSPSQDHFESSSGIEKTEISETTNSKHNETNCDLDIDNENEDLESDPTSFEDKLAFEQTSRDIEEKLIEVISPSVMLVTNEQQLSSPAELLFEFQQHTADNKDQMNEQPIPEVASHIVANAYVSDLLAEYIDQENLKNQISSSEIDNSAKVKEEITTKNDISNSDRNLCSIDEMEEITREQEEKLEQESTDLIDEVQNHPSSGIANKNETQNQRDDSLILSVDRLAGNLPNLNGQSNNNELI